MELNNWIDEYVNDKRTQEIFGKWAEEIAEDKGLKKGLKLGIEQVAKNMLDAGLSAKEIKAYTNLSDADLKKLS